VRRHVDRSFGHRITLDMEEKRPLQRQSEDHHFWSLIMLAVTAAAFLLVVWMPTKALFVFLQRGSDPLKSDWHRHVQLAAGVLNWECSTMLAMVLEEIA